MLNVLGYNIAISARVGPLLLLRVGFIILGPHARIGPFNVIRDISGLTMDAHASLGQWNWISASSVLIAAGGQGTLSIGESSAITSRHYLDCSGGISVGRYSTVAGVRSTFITHGIDWNLSQQRTKAIQIGDYCLISSNVDVAPGTKIANRVVVGMGSTVSGHLQLDENLYIGGRATAVKSGLSGRYFTRTSGFVNPEARPANELAEPDAT